MVCSYSRSNTSSTDRKLLISLRLDFFTNNYDLSCVVAISFHAVRQLNTELPRLVYVAAIMSAYFLMKPYITNISSVINLISPYIQISPKQVDILISKNQALQILYHE